MPPSEQIDMVKGCELIFPDTVFFEKGKAKLIVRMDKEYCLQGIRNAAKLNNNIIYKDFINIVRERKKDGLGIFYLRYGPDFAGVEKNLAKHSSDNTVKLKIDDLDIDFDDKLKLTG